MEPSQRLRLDPDRPAGQQHDPERRVEQLQQRPDLFDERVVAARLEERVPVTTARSLDVVLAAGRVRQDAIHVEHDRRARRDGIVAPAPVVRLAEDALEAHAPVVTLRSGSRPLGA